MATAKKKAAFNWTQDYKPTPKQQLLHSVAANQILYGGAAGGGKSYAASQDAVAACLENPGLQVYIFRRVMADLDRTIIKTINDICGDTLGRYQAAAARYEFHNGSCIHFCAAAEEPDVDKYLGAEMHYLIVDEAVLMTPYQLRMLQTRCRLGKFKAKLEKYDAERAERGSQPQAHLFPRIAFLTNPIGGPSREYLKKKFVDPHPPLTIFRDKSTEYKDPQTGEFFPGKKTVYIPATSRDNPHLEKDYITVFTDMPPERAKALRDGDWDAIEGSALHNLERIRHCIPQFPIPKHWTRVMSIDWGTAAPFSVVWAAVSEGIIIEDTRAGREREWIIPEGAIVLYHEWYGWTGEENKGIRWGSDQVAKRILEIEKEEELGTPDYRIGDYAMWASGDGRSPQENMFVATGGKLRLRRSIKDRKANYNEFLSRLAGNETVTDADGKPVPQFFAMENCVQFWRTVPNLVLDKMEPDKGPGGRGQEDHEYDAIAYLLRSRAPVVTEDDVKVRAYEAARRKVQSVTPFY